MQSVTLAFLSITLVDDVLMDGNLTSEDDISCAEAYWREISGTANYIKFLPVIRSTYSTTRPLLVRFFVKCNHHCSVECENPHSNMTSKLLG